MSTLSLRIPDSLHEQIKKLAREDGISINQFISSAAAEKISALMTEDYLGKEAGELQRRSIMILDRKSVV